MGLSGSHLEAKKDPWSYHKISFIFIGLAFSFKENREILIGIIRYNATGQKSKTTPDLVHISRKSK